MHLYSALAEQEREFISQRTKQALQAAKARGTKLGGLRDKTMKRNVAMQEKTDAFAERHKKLLKSYVAQGHTLKKMADEMNELGLLTVKGAKFGPVQVSRMIERLGLVA